MKTSLRYLGLNAQAAWERLVQEHLNLLQELTNLESARVVLERQREDTPAFRAQMVLVVPGPDYRAEAADHTLTAALHKVVENLKRQIRASQTKRRVKDKSNLQLGKMSSQWSSAPARHRA
jgi:ribosome-associated translation inhibitor RaiA